MIDKIKNTLGANLIQKIDKKYFKKNYSSEQQEIIRKYVGDKNNVKKYFLSMESQADIFETSKEGAKFLKNCDLIIKKNLK